METNAELWKSYVPSTTTLYYVDYQENIDSDENLQQQCIQQNNLSPVNDKIDYWYGEQYEQLCDTELNDIREKMAADNIEDEFKAHEDEIRYLIEDRNDTDPVQDLIRNSCETNMFYSLGVEIPAYCNDWYKGYSGESVSTSCSKMRNALNLSVGKYDDRLEELVSNADGGELRIYFNAKFDNFISTEDTNDFKSIRFHGDVVIAIVDSYHGSGFDTTIPLDITLPFKRENLFIDSQVHYCYAKDVCGMCHDWCDSTQWSIGMTPAKTNIKTSKMSDHVQQETEYAKVFKAGKCTSGDMNITRHRDVYYDNNFPCGNHCPHCGTFWVD